MIDVEAAVGMILEAESLTDGLNDEEADRLINWGTAQARRLVTGMTDAEAAGERVQRVMAVMRAIVAVHMEQAANASADLSSSLQTLLTRYAAAFGGSATSDPVLLTDAASVLKGLSGTALLEKLIQIAEKTQGANPSAKAPPAASKPDHHAH